MSDVLVGKHFNLVTVLHKDQSYAHGAGREARYVCRCDCGNIFTAKKSAIVHSKTYSCGCEQQLQYDLAGKRFKKLVVMEKQGTDTRGEIRWKCKCDCGNETTVLSSNLRNKHTTSCGCLKGEKPNAKLLGRKHKRLYEIWTNMKTRCNNPNYQCFHAYGGKGVAVCSDWNDFEQFLEWALKSGYTRSLTIDRKDNSMGYSPENCRWVDMQTQQNNRTNNHLITVEGQTKTMAEWARASEIPYATILNRLARGWPEEQAVMLPPDRRNRAIRRCGDG